MSYAMCHKMDQDLDGLRLVALGRIPRCATCPRLAVLAAARRGRAVTGPFPEVPAACDHQVCAPMVARLISPSRARPAYRSFIRT